jgi:tripartite-type tricarboxylate transporter receptor subunit TctC
MHVTNFKRTRRDIGRIGVAALMTAATGGVLAQAYPNRNVKLIISYPAGGPSDMTGRAIARGMAAEFGQPVVVENRAGVSGLIGLETLTNSPPDGYTIMLLNNTTTTALLGQQKPLDIDKRMTTVGHFVGVRMLLVVNPKVIDVKDIAGLVNHARRSPEPLQYTTSGPGSPSQVVMEAFAIQEKFKAEHIPYKGSQPALLDTVAGRIPVMLAEASTAIEHIRSGSLRPLATVSPGRTSLLPDLKTSAEQGYPDFMFDLWFGIIAPPGTPWPLLQRIRTALRAAVQSEDFMTLMRKSGNSVEYVDGPEYRARLIKDFDRWGQLIRSTGISIN